MRRRAKDQQKMVYRFNVTRRWDEATRRAEELFGAVAPIGGNCVWLYSIEMSLKHELTLVFNQAPKSINARQLLGTGVFKQYLRWLRRYAV